MCCKGSSTRRNRVRRGHGREWYGTCGACSSCRCGASARQRICCLRDGVSACLRGGKCFGEGKEELSHVLSGAVRAVALVGPQAWSMLDLVFGLVEDDQILEDGPDFLAAELGAFKETFRETLANGH